MAVELLERQHREIRALFERLEGSSEGERASLADELATALVAHTAVEEKCLYPVTSDLRSDEDLRDALADHLVLKHAVADLLTTHVEDTSFHVKLEVLRRAFERHAQDEEENLFARVREAFDGGRLASLRDEMTRFGEELRQGKTAREQMQEADERLFDAGVLEPPRARG